MTILNESVVLDTNVFLLGLRKAHEPSEALLASLDRLRLAFPARILRELAANLTLREIHEFYDLFDATSDVRFDWQSPPAEVVQRYRILRLQAWRRVCCRRDRDSRRSDLHHEQSAFSARNHRIPLPNPLPRRSADGDRSLLIFSGPGLNECFLQASSEVNVPPQSWPHLIPQCTQRPSALPDHAQVPESRQCSFRP